jgi:ribonuclease HI
MSQDNSESENEEQKGGSYPDPSTFNTFRIFIDGSATDQAKTVKAKHLRRAGIGIYHPDSGTRISEPFDLPNPTNNRAEYLACIRALEWVLEKTKNRSLKDQAKIRVVLYTDSKLLIQSMTQWVPKWERRGWKKADGKPVKNVELVQQMHQIMKNRLPQTIFVHVKAHRSKPPRSAGSQEYWMWKGNFEADKLANQGRHFAEKIK